MGWAAYMGGQNTIVQANTPRKRPMIKSLALTNRQLILRRLTITINAYAPVTSSQVTGMLPDSPLLSAVISKD